MSGWRGPRRGWPGWRSPGKRSRRSSAGRARTSRRRGRRRSPAAAAEAASAGSLVTGGPPAGVVAVPPWRPGLAESVLPPSYRDLLEVLADAGRPLRAGSIAAAAGLSTVRVIEYQLEDEAGEVSETFALITTLLDPGAAPARELAGLYHARWEIETALGAFKTELKGAGIVLRSKTPAGAEQEIWALLCACHAIRELICAAAALASQDPLRISFVNALDVVRSPVGSPGPFPPSPA